MVTVAGGDEFEALEGGRGLGRGARLGNVHGFHFRPAWAFASATEAS